MKPNPVTIKRAAGLAPVLVLALAAVISLAAAGGEDVSETSRWEQFKNLFKEGESETLPPADEVFTDAERYFHGRETWYGGLVRKTFGEDGSAYEKLPGVTRKNYTRARELYQKVVDNYPFSKYAPPSVLGVANCHYEMEEYEEAAIWYGQFCKMHSRREEVPYALYQEGMCHFEQMRRPPRDQDQTRDALVIFEGVAARFPDSDYAEQAKEKIARCNDNLARHELLAADFYYKKREYWSAAARYRGVWVSYPGLGFDDRAMFMEGSCYQDLGKDDLASQLYARAAEKFPGTDYGNKARARMDELKAKGAVVDEAAPLAP